MAITRVTARKSDRRVDDDDTNFPYFPSRVTRRRTHLNRRVTVPNSWERNEYEYLMQRDSEEESSSEEEEIMPFPPPLLGNAARFRIDEEDIGVNNSNQNFEEGESSRSRVETNEPQVEQEGNISLTFILRRDASPPAEVNLTVPNDEDDPEECDPEEYDLEECDPEEYDPEKYDPEENDPEECDSEEVPVTSEPMEKECDTNNNQFEQCGVEERVERYLAPDLSQEYEDYGYSSGWMCGSPDSEGSSRDSTGAS